MSTAQVVLVVIVAWLAVVWLVWSLCRMAAQADRWSTSDGSLKPDWSDRDQADWRNRHG